MKRLALPTWNDRLSPLFDSATKILLVDVDGGREITRSEVTLREEDLPFRAKRLADLGVDVLLCGAISRSLASMLASSEIVVDSFLTGRVEELLHIYLTGKQPDTAYQMPGCPSRQCRGGGGRRRRYRKQKR